MHDTGSFSVEILKLRHQFMLTLRKWLIDDGFIEIETPYLIAENTPDPYIDPILAQLNHPNKHTMQLRTSPEIWLKKALGLGIPKLYELARVFRDDPLSNAHHREFTMLEWYRAHADLDYLIKDLKEIFSIAHEVAFEHSGQKIPYLAFKQISIEELFRVHADIDLTTLLSEDTLLNTEKLTTLLESKKEHFPKEATFMDAFFHVMLKYIEPKLDKEVPTIITRWPLELAALAEPCADDDRFCQRFEIYYQGLEIANAYQECNDRSILLNRFKKENQIRAKLNKPTFPIDESMLDAVSSLPKSAGIALGVDRLLQACCRIECIGDLIFGAKDH